MLLGFPVAAKTLLQEAPEVSPTAVAVIRLVLIVPQLKLKQELSTSIVLVGVGIGLFVGV